MIEYGKVTKKELYDMVQQHEAQQDGNRQAIDAVNARLAQNQQLINRVANADALAGRLRVECEAAKTKYTALLERIGTVGLWILENGPAGVAVEKPPTEH